MIFAPQPLLARDNPHPDCGGKNKTTHTVPFEA